MTIEKNISLLEYNTFHIEATASQFASFETEEELVGLLNNTSIDKNNVHILGGGSNILCTKNIEGTILKNNIKHITILEETSTHIKVSFGAGELWHDCVCWAVENNYGGIENLSLIPGTIGAAPIQNIGAYGVELKDVFISCEVLEVESGKKKTIEHKECDFGYRTSIFKTTHKNKYVITSVTLQLTKIHTYNTSYGCIDNELQGNNLSLSLKNIADTVIRIRQSKLPDPKQIGNAGSFFKNPVIENSVFENIKLQFPNVPHFATQGQIKIPAAWLIEQSGWKGYKENNFGVHTVQPLVLVNYSNCSGLDIYQLSEKIIATVLAKFQIELEREVNIW